jgi:hypothetical protein
VDDDGAGGANHLVQIGLAGKAANQVLGPHKAARDIDARLGEIGIRTRRADAVHQVKMRDLGRWAVQALGPREYMQGRDTHSLPRDDDASGVDTALAEQVVEEGGNDRPGPVGKEQRRARQAVRGDRNAHTEISDGMAEMLRDRAAPHRLVEARFALRGRVGRGVKGDWLHPPAMARLKLGVEVGLQRFAFSIERQAAVARCL